MSILNGFVIEGTCLTAYTGNDADIKIPDFITEIGKGAFYRNKSIQSIKLPPCIQTIGDNAFHGCENLESIEIADGPVEIPQFFACACPNLKHVSLPSTLKHIDKRAFSDCSSLESIVVPEGVIYIEERAFFLCTSLKSVTLPSTLRQIGKRGFSLCNSLASIALPHGISRLGDLAFAECINLRKLTIPSTLTSIGSLALRHCPDDMQLRLPESITEPHSRLAELLWNSFCENELSSCIVYNFLDRHPSFISSSAERVETTLSFQKEIINTAIKLNNVRVLREMLKLCKKPTPARLDKMIEQCEDSFQLKMFLLDYKSSLYSPEQLEALEQDKLEKDLGLKERTLEEWSEIFELICEDDFVIIKGYLGDDTDVVIPDRIAGKPVEEIYEEAFQYNDEITSITIPETVKRIGHHAFNIVKSLKKVFTPNIEAWLRIEFADQYANPLSNYVGLYVGDKQISNLVIPEGVTRVNDFAFSCITGLESITLPQSLKAIGEHSFFMCKGITEITIPPSVKVIEPSAFSCCVMLEDIYLSDGVEYIDAHAFSSCYSLTRLRIPASLTTIHSSAFGSIHSAIRFELPEGIDDYEGSVLRPLCIAFDFRNSGEYLARNILESYLPLVQSTQPLADKIRECKERLINLAISDDDTALLGAFFSLYHPFPRDELDALIDSCGDGKQIKDFLVGYANEAY